jgi:sulfite exporter TauE/SafE/plastocyanin domain-containing protein/copper chaperone CopZ
MPIKSTISISGMHCKSCEIMIEKELKKIHGITAVHVNHQTGVARIKHTEPLKTDEVRAAVEAAGYQLGKAQKLPWFSNQAQDYINLLWAALILGAAFYAARGLGLFELNVDTTDMGFLVVLLIGLVAGISTCMALVGGLVLALSARHAEIHPEATAKQKFRPHLYFNLGRILGYGFLGGLIGLLGAAVTPSIGTLGIMTILVGIVMIFLGLKLIEIFPALRNKSLTLPKFISERLGLQNETREYSHKSAFITGALTFFLPCGFTQAMQLYAVSTGSFFKGATVMALFALGTAPGLIGIGWLSSAFKGQKARLFFAVAGLAVILLGGVNITNGSQLMGGISGIFGNKNATTLNTPSVSAESETQSKLETQIVRMTEDYDGYSPNQFTIKKGKPVKWIIDAKNIYTCASQLIMPSMGIQKSLNPGENVILFTPTKTGEIPFSCSMGMYRGKFIVTDDDSAAVPATTTAPIASSGGGCSMMGGSRPVAQTAPDPKINLADAQVIKSDYTQSYGLTPYEFTVKKEKPVKWVINMKEPPAGCMRAIVISELGVSQPNPDSGEMTVVFQPKEAGDLNVTCAMGMQRALIHVI